MAASTLDNPRSDRIKRLAQLQTATARKKQGKFLVEGPGSVRELVRFAPHLVSEIFFTEATRNRYTEIFADALRTGLATSIATDDVINAISQDAQSVLAVASIPSFQLADVTAKLKLVAILHNVRDPGNAGTVVRVADAAGADLVIFTGNSVEITNPKVVRSTVGSLFHLPVIPDKDLTGVINELRTRGLTILAADGKGEISLPKVSSLDRPTGWLFGNEAWGLDDRDAALADQIVSVPIYGQAESLNLATAAAVCLYASANALHSK